MSDPSRASLLVKERTFKDVQWSDVDADAAGDGRATGVCGLLFGQLSSKQLRTVTSRLGIKGVKNARKNEMIDKIIQHHRNRNAYEEMLTMGSEDVKMDSSPRKNVHCSFRLINILFSERFADAFATLGDVASGHTLDMGNAANEKGFWQMVEQAFGEPNEEFDVLRFMYDDILGAQEHIDPSNIVRHDWRQLRSIWKSVNADYKAALDCFSVSGTPDSNFFNFCDGNLDVYYLRKNLEVRPELNATVEADLPEETALSSEDKILDMDTKMGRSGSDSKRKRKNDAAELAEAIREYGGAKMTTELAKQRLLNMQREDARKDKMHQQQFHQNMFDEWEKVQQNIRSLRRDLAETTLSQAVRTEIEQDIEGLLRRKHNLSRTLGFN